MDKEQPKIIITAEVQKLFWTIVLSEPLLVLALYAYKANHLKIYLNAYLNMGNNSSHRLLFIDSLIT